ncbi:hypothetical protein BBAD15_g453 [Beauveria bassiana D1-5]|uniref:Uncharacterized protein n=1 Tax=Beauveria bassiana D1-5 TaxID=1245745 RepID=A0A0A2WKL5_BEABA|nr:hypothetical protein BBAD15_g453 [Beauveria bassiana D1-5]
MPVLIVQGGVGVVAPDTNGQGAVLALNGCYGVAVGLRVKGRRTAVGAGNRYQRVDAAKLVSRAGGVSAVVQVAVYDGALRREAIQQVRGPGDVRRDGDGTQPQRPHVADIAQRPGAGMQIRDRDSGRAAQQGAAAKGAGVGMAQPVAQRPAHRQPAQYQPGSHFEHNGSPAQHGVIRDGKGAAAVAVGRGQQRRVPGGLTDRGARVSRGVLRRRDSHNRADVVHGIHGVRRGGDVQRRGAGIAIWRGDGVNEAVWRIDAIGPLAAFQRIGVVAVGINGQHPELADDGGSAGGRNGHPVHRRQQTACRGDVILHHIAGGRSRQAIDRVGMILQDIQRVAGQNRDAAGVHQQEQVIPAAQGDSQLA